MVNRLLSTLGAVPPGGGGSAPIQNTRYWDPAFTGTADGSIGAPYALLAPLMAELAASTEAWLIHVPPGLAIPVDADVPSFGAEGALVLQGITPDAAIIGQPWVIGAQPSNAYMGFRDVWLTTLEVSAAGTIQFEFSNCFVDAFTLDPGLNGSARQINSGCTDCGWPVTGFTLQVFGGSMNGVCSWSDGRFHNVQLGGGSTFTPGAGETLFVGCTFGGGITISNANAPAVLMDAFSHASFLAASGVFAGTITVLNEAAAAAAAAQATADTALAAAAAALTAANEADDTADAAQATANAAVPVARVLTATSPLQIDGGASASLAGDRTFSVLPVSNTTAGVAPQHAGAGDVGKALIATATGSAWGTDFGAQPLTTTGPLRLGASLPSVGAIQLANTLQLVWRSNAGANIVGLQVTSSNVPTFGDASFNTAVVATNTITLSLGGGHSLAYNTLAGNQLLFGVGGGAITATFGMAPYAGLGSLFTTHGQNSTAVAGTGGARLDRAGDATGPSGVRTGGAYDVRPGSGASAGGVYRILNGAGAARFTVSDVGMGFFGSVAAQQNITGSRGGNAALADLLTKLALTGLLTDGTS